MNRDQKELLERVKFTIKSERAYKTLGADVGNLCADETVPM